MGALIEGAFYVQRADGSPDLVYEPQAHQKKFHASVSKYCIMEGGAGSGKSICMRWDAYMRCWAVPRFTALIPPKPKSHSTPSFSQRVLMYGKSNVSPL